MGIFKFIGSLVYGAVMYYLLWLLFYWITPYVMSMSWGLFIVYLFVAGGALTMFVASVASIIGMPLVLLCRKCKVAKYAPIIFGLFFGYSAVKLPWILSMEYGVLQWILGISLTITIVITFISLMAVPFNSGLDD